MNYHLTSRAAEKLDISKIAAVHIQSWKETYPGIIPERKIASLSMEACSRNLGNALASGSHVFYPRFAQAQPRGPSIQVGEPRLAPTELIDRYGITNMAQPS